MTPSDTERLAREAGIDASDDYCVNAEEEGAGHITPYQLSKFADLVLELAANECDALEARAWDAYKRGPRNSVDSGNPHTEGKSDGAGECASAIRAMKGRE